MGNGARVTALAIGTINLAFENSSIIVLNNCLFVPDIIKNIISIPVLDREGFRFTIENGNCSIFKYSNFIYSGSLTNCLYTFTPHKPIFTIQKNKRKLDNHSSMSL